MKTLCHILLSIPILLLSVNSLHGQDAPPPHVRRWVTDLSGTLSSSEVGQLNQRLRDFEDSTSTQVVVVIVPTLDGRPIEETALAIAETNRIGKKGKDNGVLLLIAREEREIRIEVGYGLEGVLTDAVSGRIIRNEIVPFFRQGNYFSGVEAGVEAIMLATRNEYTADRLPDSSGALPFLLLLFFMLFFVIGSFRRRTPRLVGGSGPMIFTGMGGFGSSRGSWGGGGFSGGGGSFGGGGASGRW